MRSNPSTHTALPQTREAHVAEHGSDRGERLVVVWTLEWRRGLGHEGRQKRAVGVQRGAVELELLRQQENGWEWGSGRRLGRAQMLAHEYVRPRIDAGEMRSEGGGTNRRGASLACSFLHCIRASSSRLSLHTMTLSTFGLASNCSDTSDRHCSRTVRSLSQPFSTIVSNVAFCGGVKGGEEEESEFRKKEERAGERKRGGFRRAVSGSHLHEDVIQVRAVRQVQCRQLRAAPKRRHHEAGDVIGTPARGTTRSHSDSC